MNLIEKYPDFESSIIDVLHDPDLHSRKGIQAFADHIHRKEESLGEDPFPLYHSFSDGIYAREVHLPKDHIVIGKLHKHESMVYMLKGHAIVADENGCKEIKAPCHFVSKPGVKRVGYIIEDIVWIDIHNTKSSNIKDAEKEIFANSYEELDYFNMVKELGLNESQIRIESENEADMIFDSIDGVETKESAIEGTGCFASRRFKEGESVGDARLDEKRTLLGRYTNHSGTPNLDIKINADSVEFLAKKDIKEGEELTIDYKLVRQIIEGELCQE